MSCGIGARANKTDGGRAWWRWEHAICAALAISHLTDAQHIYATPSLFYFPPSLRLLSSWPSATCPAVNFTLFCCSANQSACNLFIRIPTRSMLSKTSGWTPVIVGLPNWLEGHWHQLTVHQAVENLFSLQWIERKWTRGWGGKRMTMMPNLWR